MELVKLKMKMSYKIILVIIFLLLVLLLSIGGYGFLNDDIMIGDSDILVSGDLSINYLDGTSFSLKDEEAIKFSVTNSSDTSYNFKLILSMIRGDGNYSLYFKDEVISEGELTTTDSKSIENILVEANSTNIYSLVVKNTGSNHLKFDLEVSQQDLTSLYFSEVLLKNNEIKKSATTKVGTELATTDEGLIQDTDDLGTSYYFRGNVVNNYVSFADNIWRIVRINGDGTIRMILDGTAGLGTYYDTYTSEFTFNNSKMQDFLDNWYSQNLVDYVDYLANTKYCSDIYKDDTNNFNAYTRLVTNKIPSFSCLGDVLTNTIGLLTADEALFAGATLSENNTSYYLYNSKITSSWYTETAGKGTDTSINFFMVSSNGKIEDDINANLYRDVRPVISIIKNSSVTGDGTQDNPYIVE